MVLVTPYIITRSGQSVSMPIGKKLENLGFKRIQPFLKDMFSADVTGLVELIDASSLVEVDERHKICREIHVYQK